MVRKASGMVLLGCSLGLVLLLLLGKLSTPPLQSLVLLKCKDKLKQINELVKLLMYGPVMSLDVQTDGF